MTLKGIASLLYDAVMGDEGCPMREKVERVKGLEPSTFTLAT